NAGSPPASGAPSTTGGRGIGLPNTRARLAQLYGARYGLSMGTDARGHTTVTIELPWHDIPEPEPVDVAAEGPPDPTGLTGEHPVAGEPTRGTIVDAVPWRFALFWAGVGLVWITQDLALPALERRPVMPWEAGRVESLSALVLDVRPQFLRWLLDRAAHAVVVDPARGERLAERMADFLRLLLDAAGQPGAAPRDAAALDALADELHALALGEAPNGVA